jgi:hypothetical protein
MNKLLFAGLIGFASLAAQAEDVVGQVVKIDPMYTTSMACAGYTQGDCTSMAVDYNIDPNHQLVTMNTIDGKQEIIKVESKHQLKVGQRFVAAIQK